MDKYECPICNKMITKYHFVRHLKNEHGVNDIENLYVQTKLDGVYPTCLCGCEKQLRFSNWNDGYPCKYTRGHNAVNDTTFRDPEHIKKNSDKRRQGYIEGRYKVWNKGLTRKTSKKVRKLSEKASRTIRKKYKSGEIVPWQIGLTKDTDERIARSSNTKRKKFLKGELIQWNKGLTKDTDKRIKTIAQKISKSYESREAGRRLSVKSLIERLSAFSDKFTLVSNHDEYKTRKDHLKFQCTTCKCIQEKSLSMLETVPVCFNCHPKESNAQLEIYEFVKSLCDDVELSNRTALNGKEIDIYIPSKNFGIEYNGLYWHSSKFLKNDYHDKKIECANSLNISLMMIYEDEWKNKSEIVKSMIRHRLGIHKKRIEARKLIVKEITSRKDAREFFNKNHLEGYTKSKKIFGLYTKEGEILAAMLIRRPFHKEYLSAFEVSRSCIKLEHNIPGWIEKLSKFAHEDLDTQLLTYVDSRVSQGQSYIKAGWKFKSMTASPRFWWTNYVNRFNRFEFKADKSRGMTQRQVADEAKVVEIFGCKNYVLTYMWKYAM